MNTTTAVLPASSLLDLTTRRVPPFDQPVYISELDGTRLDPPVLLEMATPCADPDLPGWVVLDIWTKNHGPHMMTGVIVNPAATVGLALPADPFN